MASTSKQTEIPHKTTDDLWYTTKDIDNWKPIGCGNEGKVYLCPSYKTPFQRRANKPVAAKIFYEIDEERKKQIQDLASFFKKKRHKYVVSIINPLILDDSVLPIRHYGYIMEFMNGESLKTVIESKAEYSRSQIGRWMKMTAKGLQFLQEQNILYRNIRPANMLLSMSGNALKLSDFGIRRRYNGKIRIQNDSFYYYIAPEVLARTGDINDPAADIYALGIILWELLCKKPPYAKSSTIVLCEKIIDGERPTLDSAIFTQILEEFIISCWSQNPEKRPKLSAFLLFIKDRLYEEEKVQERSKLKKLKRGKSTKKIKSTRKIKKTVRKGEDWKREDASKKVYFPTDFNAMFEQLVISGDPFQGDPSRRHSHGITPTASKTTKIVTNKTYENTSFLGYSEMPKFLIEDLTVPLNFLPNAGSFGSSIFKVFSPVIGWAALKKIRSREFLAYQIWEREVEEIYRLGRHPNIVTLYGLVWNKLTDSMPTGILMEFMEGGSLSNCIPPDPSKLYMMPPNFKNTWAKQIALGLNFIHKEKIVHGNLKPDNILLSKNCLVTKISNFASDWPIDFIFPIPIGVCNPVYTAPEVYWETINKCTESSDIWSYGMILYFIYYERNPYNLDVLLRVPPFMRVECWKGNLQVPDIPQRPPLDGKDIDNMIQKCCTINPRDRCRMTEVVEYLHKEEEAETSANVSEK